MKTANPYINFAGQTEEAFNHYKSIFGGEFTALMRFSDFGQWADDLPEPDRGKIAHVALPLGENCLLMGTDVLESLGQSLEVGTNFQIAIEPESREEAAELLRALGEGGGVGMELQETEWAELFGSCTDKFGMTWMINYPGSKRQ